MSRNLHYAAAPRGRCQSLPKVRHAARQCDKTQSIDYHRFMSQVWHVPMASIDMSQVFVTHATMLRDTSGFQWHMPKTCDMDCVLCHIVALRVAPSILTDTCCWVPLHNVDCVTQAHQNDIDLINSMLRSSIRFIASRNSFVQQIFLC